MKNMTYELAFAIGHDAANRHMSAHTIKPWNEEAYNVAVRTTNRLLLHVLAEEGGLKGLDLNEAQRQELGIS